MLNIFASKGEQTVWRKPNKERGIANLSATVKHGGGCMMVWGCSAHWIGNLIFIEDIINQYDYIDILNRNLVPGAEKMGIRTIFKLYTDNDSKHNSFNERLSPSSRYKMVPVGSRKNRTHDIILKLWSVNHNAGGFGVWASRLPAVDIQRLQCCNCGPRGQCLG